MEYIEEMEKSEKESGQRAPEGYTPLRNTLAAAGVSVGYDATKDAPIVNGQTLNTNDSRLVKVGDDYWIEEGFAKSFIPKAYENPYQKETASILSELADMEFSYDPSKDSALRAAQDQAMLAAKQSANARGLLGGSTAETMRQRAAQEMVSLYEQKAYDRFQDNRKSKIEMLSVLDSLADSAFDEYAEKTSLAQKDRAFAQDVQEEADRQVELNRDMAVKTFANQLDKVLAMGVVDAEAADVLGVEAGTLTWEQKEFLEKIRTEEEAEARRLEEEKQKEELAWERKKELLRLETDEKIRAALATRK